MRPVVLFSCILPVLALGVMGCENDSGKKSKSDVPQTCPQECSTVKEGYTCDLEELTCNCHGTVCGETETCTPTGCKRDCLEDCNSVLAGYTCDTNVWECNCRGRRCALGEDCTSDGCSRLPGDLIAESVDGNEVVLEGDESGVVLRVTLSKAPTDEVLVDWTLLWSSYEHQAGRLQCTADAKPFVLTPENYQSGELVRCAYRGTDQIMDEDQTFRVRFMATTKDTAFQNYYLDKQLTLKDTDEAKLLVELPESLNTSEDRDSVDINFSLSARPYNKVWFNLAIENDDGTTEPYATISTEQMSFEYSDFNRPRRVIVTGTDDGKKLNSTPHSYHLNLSLDRDKTTDEAFKNIEPVSIAMLNLDNDSPNIIAAKSTFEVSELLTSESITVSLVPPPVVDTNVTVTVSDPNECVVIDSLGNKAESTELIFLADEDIAQSITVRGVNDNVDDGDKPCKLTITATSSDTNPDTTFNGKTLEISGINKDDDTAEILGFSGQPNTIYERGIGGPYSGFIQFKLGTQPTSDVTFQIAANNTDSSDHETHLYVELDPITFTPENYDTPQNIVYNARWDRAATTQRVVEITAKASSEDKKYDKWTKKTRIVVKDEDVPGLVVGVYNPVLSEAKPNEYGRVVFKLATKPTKEVTVTADSSQSTRMIVSATNSASAAGSSATLTVQPDEWDTEKTFYVFPVNDNHNDGDTQAHLTLKTSSLDTKYFNVTTQSPSFYIQENDPYQITVNCSGKATCSKYTTDGLCEVSIDSSQRPTNNASVKVSCTSDEVGYWWSDLTLSSTNNYKETLSSLMSKHCANQTTAESTKTAHIYCTGLSGSYVASGTGTIKYEYNDEN